MAKISKKTIMPVMLVYGITRSVVDDIKGAEGDESLATDQTVFNETMKAFYGKEGSNGK